MRRISLLTILLVATAISPTCAKDFPDSRQATDYYNQGTSCQAKGDLDAALTNYTKALAIEPSACMYYAIGTVYQRQHKDAQSIVAYKQAAHMEPTNARYQNAAATTSRYYKAAELSKAAIAQQKAGKVHAALKIYKKALHLVPEDAATCANIGTAYQQIEDYPKAQECYAKAVSLAPKGQADKLYWIAVFDEYANNGKKAIENYEKYLKAQGENAEYSQQAKDRLQALRADPSDVLPIIPEKERKSCVKADSLWQQAVQLQSDNKFDEAIAFYQQAIALRPSASALYYSAGTAYYAKDQLDEAVKYFEKAVQLKPTVPGYQYALKLARQELTGRNLMQSAIEKQSKGDKEGAVADYRAALEIYVKMHADMQQGNPDLNIEESPEGDFLRPDGKLIQVPGL